MRVERGREKETDRETSSERGQKRRMSEDLEERDEEGRTALRRACEDGDLEEAQSLIDKGANIEAEDNINGWSPLVIASWKGHEPIVRLLIDKGANIEAWALQEAAFGGHASILEL